MKNYLVSHIFSPLLGKKIQKRGKWLAIIFLLAGGLTLLISGLLWIEINLTTTIAPSPSPRIYARDGTLIRADLNDSEEYLFPLPTTEIPQSVQRAIIAAEDRRFWSHPGVDPLAVLRATYQNLRHGQIKSGASTITMQLARMLQPAPRTFSSKLRETLRAIIIEIRHSKEDILRAYLNRLPVGGNLRGIQTGARYYFNRPASALSHDQAALLAAIPRSPRELNPLRNPRPARQRRNFVLSQAARYYNWSADVLTALKERPLTAEAHPFPHIAPHFTDVIRAQMPEASLRSSLDLRKQRRVEKIVNSALDRLHNRGIQHLAVVVLDNQNREILAYEGSGNFYAEGTESQVQGPLALRSPGSALKPFLYALAIDENHLTPERRLIDVPTRYSSFRPENFDRDFYGLISARQALRGSLNIPAVRLLREVGVERFHKFMRQAGFQLSGPSERYGLGLALGGGDVTLLNLTNAYASLADKGRYKPVRWLYSAGSETSKTSLTSPESAYLVTDMLGRDHLDEFKLPASLKTGTSTGRRDAWTVVYNPRLTVGVWTGNFNRRSSQALIGRQTAKPIARRIMRALHPGGTGPSFQKPEGFVEREVCAISGRPASPHCPDTIKTLAPADQPAGPTCNLHKQVLVSEDSPYSYCAACAPDDAESQVFADYPPLLKQHLASRGRLTNQLPPHHPDCPYHQESDDLRLVDPGDETIYWHSGEARVPVLAAGGQKQNLHLFKNEDYLGQIESGENHWLSPSPGEHEITVLDSHGRSKTHRVLVKDP